MASIPEVKHCVSKNIPDIIRCNLKGDSQILMIFGTNIFDKRAIKWPFTFPPYPTSVSALPGKCRTRNVDKFKKRLLESGFRWSRTSLTQLSMNAESVLYLRKELIFGTFVVSSSTDGQLNKLRAKVTGIWAKCALCVLF